MAWITNCWGVLGQGVLGQVFGLCISVEIYPKNTEESLWVALYSSEWDY